MAPSLEPLVYTKVFEPPRYSKGLSQKEYCQSVNTWLEETGKFKPEKNPFRKSYNPIRHLNGPVYKLLSTMLSLAYVRDRRIQPIELTLRFVAALCGLKGKHAKWRAKMVLMEATSTPYLSCLREAAGNRGGLYLLHLMPNQPPPIVAPTRPQTEPRIKPAKYRDNRGRFVKPPENCGLGGRPQTPPLKKAVSNKGVEKNRTSQTTPKTEVGQMAAKAAEMFKPGKCKNADISSSSSTKAEDGKASQPTTAPQSPSPSAPSMPPSAPTARAETAPEPTEAAPESPEASRKADTAPAPAPAVDPALAAAQAKLAAAREAQGILAPAGPQPSIEEVQAKLMERRRWQDHHTVRKTMQSIGEPLDRAPGSYTVVYKDPNDNDKAPPRTRQQFGGGPVRQAGTPTQNILGGIRVADDEEIAQLLAEEPPN